MITNVPNSATILVATQERDATQKTLPPEPVFVRKVFFVDEVKCFLPSSPSPTQASICRSSVRPRGGIAEHIFFTQSSASPCQCETLDLIKTTPTTVKVVGQVQIHLLLPQAKQHQVRKHIESNPKAFRRLQALFSLRLIRLQTNLTGVVR